MGDRMIPDTVLMVLLGQAFFALVLVMQFRRSRTILPPKATRRLANVTPLHERVNDIPVEQHDYLIIDGDELRYDGDDLHVAKDVRTAYPGSVLVADGVNRG